MQVLQHHCEQCKYEMIGHASYILAERAFFGGCVCVCHPLFQRVNAAGGCRAQWLCWKQCLLSPVYLLREPYKSVAHTVSCFRWFQVDHAVGVNNMVRDHSPCSSSPWLLLSFWCYSQQCAVYRVSAWVHVCMWDYPSQSKWICLYIDPLKDHIRRWFMTSTSESSWSSASLPAATLPCTSTDLSWL